MSHLARRFAWRRLALCVTLACMAAGAQARPLVGDQAMQLIRSLHPGAVQTEADTGDFDGDGVPDVAYLACWSEGGMECVLGVLRGRPDGGFTRAGVSARFPLIQRFPEIHVQGRSIFVSLLRNSLSEIWTTSAQLQFRGGRYIVIGRESVSQPAEPGLGDEERTSTNLLTGVQIRTIKARGKVSTHHSRVSPDSADELGSFQP